MYGRSYIDLRASPLGWNWRQAKQREDELAAAEREAWKRGQARLREEREELRYHRERERQKRATHRRERRRE